MLPSILLAILVTIFTGSASGIFYLVPGAGDALATIFTYGPGAWIIWQGIESRRQQARESGSVDERLARAVVQLNAALKESTLLSTEVTAEVAAKVAALEKARVEAEHWESLAKLNEEEAKAVATLVESKVERGVRHLDKMGWVYAISGWVVAVLVITFGPYIPVVKH